MTSRHAALPYVLQLLLLALPCACRTAETAAPPSPRATVRSASSGSLDDGALSLTGAAANGADDDNAPLTLPSTSAGACRPVPRLAGRPLVAAEVEAAQLVRKWPFHGRLGPGRPGETYRFIADTGVAQELAHAGFNAVVLVPSAAGALSPEAQYGTEAAFVRMVDALAKAGIGVVVSVPSTITEQRTPAALAALACRDGLAGFRVEAADEEQVGAVDSLAEELREQLPDVLVLGPRHTGLTRFLTDGLVKPARSLDLGALRDELTGGAHAHMAVRTVSLVSATEAATPYVASRLAGSDWYYIERKTMAFGALALLSGDADVELLQTRLLQQGSVGANPAVDWALLGRDSPRLVYGFFAALSRLVRTKPAFRAVSAAPGSWDVDMRGGHRVVSLHRRDPATGAEVYAVVNLSHVGLSLYGLGVDTHGSFRVVFDGDAAALGGSGELARRLPDGIVVADGGAIGARSSSLTLPYLAPYATVVLEKL